MDIAESNARQSDYFRWWDHPLGRIAGTPFDQWREEQKVRDREATERFVRSLKRRT